MTPITIFGAGRMARALAIRFLTGGNAITLLSRTPDPKDPLLQELAPYATQGGSVKTGQLGAPLADPVIISAISYTATLEVVRTYGSQLAGKVLVDISNPLAPGFQELSIPTGTSAAEEIARVVPSSTQVVKAFNTIFDTVLALGQAGGQPLDVFLASDHAGAKATLAQLITASGMRPVDAGPLRRARQLEQMTLLIINLQGSQAHPRLNAFKLLG